MADHIIQYFGYHNPGTVRPITWYDSNMRCTACQEQRAEVMVLVRGQDYGGVYWTRACAECAPTLSAMAALGELAPHD